MSFLRDFGLVRDRSQEAVLRERVNTLQAALDTCKGAARRWNELRWAVEATIAVVCLAIGFALGSYSGSLKHAGGDLLAAVGVARSAPDPAVASAAFQKGDFPTALTLAQPLAEQGNTSAQTILALIYYRGRGVTQNHHEAVKWFRRAADQGDATAQFYLGVMFAEGQGVPQDYAEAAKWYRLAAERGDAQAQYNLGLAYIEGEGVTPDNVAAHMWFNLAAARFPATDTRNRLAAVKNRDVVAAKMTPEQVAEAQKLAREWAQQ